MSRDANGVGSERCWKLSTRTVLEVVWTRTVLEVVDANGVRSCLDANGVGSCRGRTRLKPSSAFGPNRQRERWPNAAAVAAAVEAYVPTFFDLLYLFQCSGSINSDVMFLEVGVPLLDLRAPAGRGLGRSSCGTSSSSSGAAVVAVVVAGGGGNGARRAWWNTESGTRKESCTSQYVDNPKNAIVNEVFTYMMDKIGTLQNLWPMQVMSPRCRPDVSDPDGRHGRRLPIRGLSRTWCMDRFKTISDEKHGAWTVSRPFPTRSSTRPYPRSSTPGSSGFHRRPRVVALGGPSSATSRSSSRPMAATLCRPLPLEQRALILMS